MSERTPEAHHRALHRSGIDGRGLALPEEDREAGWPYPCTELAQNERAILLQTPSGPVSGFVFKSLLGYQDERGLGSGQEDLIDMLYRDRLLAPSMALGLIRGSVDASYRAVRTSGALITHPTVAGLNPEANYLYVMRYAPSNVQRLIALGHLPIAGPECPTNDAQTSIYLPATVVNFGKQLVDGVLTLLPRLEQYGTERPSRDREQAKHMYASPEGLATKHAENRAWGEQRIHDTLQAAQEATDNLSRRQQLRALQDSNRRWWQDMPQLVWGKDSPYCRDAHERLQAGQVIDGHGDLQLRNLYLGDDGLVALDSADKAAYRIQDRLAELAMLLVDYEAQLRLRAVRERQQDVTTVLLSPFLGRQAGAFLGMRGKFHRQHSSDEAALRQYIDHDVIQVGMAELTGYCIRTTTVEEHAAQLQAQRTLHLSLADKAMVKAILALGFERDLMLGEIYLDIAGRNMRTIEQHIAWHQRWHAMPYPPAAEAHSGTEPASRPA